MPSSRHRLFLASLLLAAACSDAGDSLGPNLAEPDPASSPADALAVLTCRVDVRAGTEVCAPGQPGVGGALGAIAIGNASQVTLTKTNVLVTADSVSFDRTITNNIYQALGTTDGVTPHPSGVRIWVEPAKVTDTTVVGQPASVVVDPASRDGVLTYKTYTNRPFFQYAGLLQSGATSAARHWRFLTSNVDAFTYTVFVLAEVQYEAGTLWITPDAPVVQTGESATLAAHVRDATKLSLDPLTWTSSNPSVVTVTESGSADSLAQITAVGEGMAWVTAVSNHPRADYAAPRRDSVLVTVNNAPVVAPDTVYALARVSIRLSPDRMRRGMAAGDSVVPGQVVETANGSAVVDADGGFTYVSKGPFTGTDSVPVDVTDGTWTVQRTLHVEVAPSNYWFVQQGATGDGSNARPLASVNAAVAAADGNDTLFVLRNGSNDLVEAVQMNAGQALIGHGVPASVLISASELNEPGRVDSIFQGQGLGTPLASTGAPTLRVAGNNLVEGVNIVATDAAGIHGSGFGTLATAHVSVQASGPVLSLVNGTLAGTFIALHSAGSDSSGLTLNQVSGTLAPAAASVSGAATVSVSVSGGSVNVSFAGDVTHDGSGALLSVDGGHAGNLVFGGTLAASNGTGLQFSNADGTYYLGTTNLASSGGGDAGVDVFNGSSGTFTFAAGSAITNPAGNVFRIQASAPTLTYPGTFSKSGAGTGVLIQDNTGGSITFSGPSKVLSTGASHAVAILSDEANVGFAGGGLAITTAGGRGFYTQDAGTVTVTGGGNTIATTGATALHLQNTISGPSGISFRSVSGSGAASAILVSAVTGAGVQVTGTGTGGSGGTLSATGTAVVLSAADSTRLAGVVVSAPSAIDGASFGALRLDLTSVTSSAGRALGLANGRLYVADVAVSSTGGAALHADAVTLNGTLSALSATTASGNAVLLTNALGSLTAHGGALVVNPGGGAAIAITGPTSVGLTYVGNVTQNANAALLDVSGGHSGTLVFHSGTLTAAHGSGLQFSNADGTYDFSGTTHLSNTTAGADAGIDVTNGSGGTFSFAATTTITNPLGEAIRIASSGPSFTYGGAIAKTNGSTGITVTGSTGTIAFNSISGTARTITSLSTHPAVNLAGNPGATISFGGGSLAIASDDGNAFNATGGGTVQVTGGTNTLNSTGGVALNVQNTTVGASGLTWRSISASGGASGIVLSNVGAGGVQVTGNGGECTRAAPACSGGTLQSTTGDGVSLNGVQRVRLNRVRVLNTGGHGIAGTSTSGLTLASSLVQGAGDADDEAGIFFATANGSNLTGTDSIVGSVVHAPADAGVYIHNYGGTLNLVVEGSTFSGTDIATLGVVTGDDLFRLVADRTGAGASTITARFTGNTFDQSENDGLAGIAQSSTGSGGGTLNLTVDGNAFTGDNGGVSCSSGCNDNGIAVRGTQGGVVRFAIQHNDVVNQRNEAVSVRAVHTSSVQGTLQSNTIGTATARSGSYTAQGIRLDSDDNADLVVRAHGNVVRGTFWQGIWATAADATGGSPAMDVTLTSNTTPTPADIGGTYLPSIDVQGTTAAVVCARVESNTAAAGRTSAGSVEMLQLNTAAFRIEGLPAPTDDASAYVAGKNPASASPVYAFAQGLFTAATCRTPAATPVP